MKKPLLLAAALGLTSVASAAIFTWDPSATAGIQDGAGAWDTSTANWTTDAGATDIAYGNALTDGVIIGSGGAGGTITVGTVNANTLTFATTVTSGYTLSGGTITLSGTTPTITTDNTAFSTTISSVLAGSAGLVKSGAGTLILGAENTYTGGTIVNAGTLVLADPSNNGTGSIRGVLTINSGATVSLTAANALGYSGTSRVDTVNINGGTLTTTVNGDNGWGATYNLTGGSITATNGGYLSMGTDAAAGNVQPAVITNASATTSTIGAAMRLRSGMTNSQLSFTVADGAAATDLNVSGVIASTTSGTGIVKFGAGTMALTAANTYNGATTINGGVLTLSGAGTIASTGSLALNNGATLRLDNGTTANANRVNNAAAITMNGGVIDFVSNATGSSSETLGALTIAFGANTVSISQAAVGQTSKLTITSLTRTGGSLNFVGAGLGSAVDTRGEITFTTAPTLTNGIIGAWATVNGTDLATLSGNSIVAYSGYTDINARTDTIADGAATNVRILGDGSTAGNIALGAATTTVNTLLMSNANYAATVDTASKTFLTGGVTVASGAQALTIGTTAGSGTLKAATAGGVLALNNLSANALTINAVIADNTSSGSTAFGGTGVIVLTGANTYTGGATIGAGSTVQVGAGTLGAGTSTVAALGSTSSTVNIVSGGKLIYNRAGVTAYANSILSGAGAVEFYGRNNGTTGGTLDNVQLNNSSTGFTGTMLISGIRAQVDNTGDLGSATVTVNPTGQIYFTTNATYTNNFIISGTGWGESAGLLGIFRLAGTTLAGSITLAGDSLIGTHGSTGTLSGVIGETGGARKLTLGGGSSGTTTLTLNGTNTYTGGTDLGMGSQSAAITANIGNNFAFGTGTVTVRDSATVASSGAARTLANNFAVNSGKTLTLSGAGGQLTLNGAIANGTGAGNLTVSAGTVRLAGANTYTGTTTVTGGSLIFGNRTAFYNNTPASWTETNLVVNSGATAAFAVGGAGEFSASDIDTLATLGTASGGFKSGAILGFDTTNATGGFTYASVIANPNGGANALGIAKFGANTLTLSGNNTYTGPVTVNGGTLLLSGTNAYTGATTVNGGGTLQVGGTIANTASITLNGNTAGLTILNGGSMTTVGALSLTTAGGNILTVNTGGTLAVGSISNPWGATYTIDGSMSVAGTWVISSNTNTSVSGAGTITADIINLGNSSTGFNYSGTGSLTVANKLTTSATTNGANSFTQSSGTVNLGGLQLGSAAMGTSNTQTFNLNGGRLNLGASGITSEGTGSRVINLGAGTLGARADWSSSLDMALTVASGSGTTFNTLDAADGVTARTIALSGILSGSGALTKAGAGTLTLSGANNYAGGTTVTAGTLAAGHVGALGTGAVSVSGGTLQIGATNLAGIASLAVDAGTLNTAAGSVSTTGAFTLAGGTWVLGDAADGVTAGSFTLTAGLIDLSGFTNRSTAGTYSLISGTGTSAFSDANFTNGDAGFSYSIDGNGDLVVTAVPEPSTYGLIGASLLAALAFVRRRRKAA